MGAARLIERCGGASEAVASLSEHIREVAEARAAAIVARCVEAGIVVLPRGAPEYPPMLEALEDAPLVLFALGAVGYLHAPAVAVVGTRRPSPYGLRVTRRVTRGVVEGGITVVSGLARGIDTAAHEEALEAGGATVAVLGTGVDVCYPRDNTGLYGTILRRGVVVSEVLPGTPALPGAFPRRNRIVAALADVTVVVEAGPKSGALITAQHAVGLGRSIAAVPGPVDTESHEGSNALLRDGAHVATGADDVVALVDLTTRGRTRRRQQHATPFAGDLTPVEARILGAVERAPCRADELVSVAQLTVPEVVSAIAALELRGMLAVDPVGLVHRR